jgi:triacylglycerol lipase
LTDVYSRTTRQESAGVEAGMTGRAGRIAAIAAAAMLMGEGAMAQVPPELAKKIREIGDVVDPPSTALVYRPLHGSPPYKGVKVVRDQPYGPDARQILDVFESDTAKGPRPVLIYVAGGGGNKIEAIPSGDAFYDNIMLWAVSQGMTGVSVQRRGSFVGDSNAQDVSAAIQWVHKNIAKYGGDTKRIFIWGHSAGAMSLANYLSRPDLYGPAGVGVNGAILNAGGYNLAPVEVPGAGPVIRMGMNSPPLNPAGPGGPPAPDPALLLKTSNLPGLKALTIPLFVSAAEIDPPRLRNSATVLNEELRKAGKTPGYIIYKDHGHMSEVFAVNTADHSITDPILAWMKTVK